MRKIVFLLCIFLISTISNSQTYYYKSVAAIDIKTKVKGRPMRADMYISFNEQGCWESDNKGYDINGHFFQYAGRKNGIIIYQYITSIDPFFGKQSLIETWSFSSDYKRLNIKNEIIPNNIHVFERANPEDIDVPDELY
ncbi:hypothetical protein [Parabacteroides hominis]|uniref:Uncharacterized protein n=1 Tax=Parabacteroides hominis TaxID=2763057 RepID=A0ABR7DTV3_9BACT|nr:hypothetical protein [Parabacteroides hominis]MBC5634906.1 hypothetical protein [Parabacteroides hominis]